MQALKGVTEEQTGTLRDMGGRAMRYSKQETGIDTHGDRDTGSGRDRHRPVHFTVPQKPINSLWASPFLLD